MVSRNWHKPTWERHYICLLDSFGSLAILLSEVRLLLLESCLSFYFFYSFPRRICYLAFPNGKIWRLRRLIVRIRGSGGEFISKRFCVYNNNATHLNLLFISNRSELIPWRGARYGIWLLFVSSDRNFLSPWTNYFLVELFRTLVIVFTLLVKGNGNSAKLVVSG